MSVWVIQWTTPLDNQLHFGDFVSEHEARVYASLLAECGAQVCDMWPLTDAE